MPLRTQSTLWAPRPPNGERSGKRGRNALLKMESQRRADLLAHGDRRFNNSTQNARIGEDMEALGEEEAHAFREMIRWMLTFRPGERPSVDQVLEKAWMKKWAIPEAEKTWEDSKE